MARTTAPTPSEPGRWVVSKFGPPSVLHWEKFDRTPIPAENEVRVRILVAGIGSVDNIQRAGGYPDPLTTSPGFTPGYEFVGVIDELGSGVHDLSVGAHVVSMCKTGAYATHIVIPVSEVFPIAAADNAVKIAALPLNYMTAFGMLQRSGVELSRGSRVLIGSAAGGLGTAIAQLNSALDWGLVLIGTCSPRNFEFLKSLGVTPVDRYAEDLPAQVKELTGGQGVDIAFNVDGSEKSIRQTVDCTIKDTGEVRVLGIMSSINPGGEGMNSESDNTFDFLQHRPTPRTHFWSVTHDYYFPERGMFNGDFEKVLRAVRDGRLDPLIGKLFRLDGAVQANELIANGAPFEGHMAFLVESQIAKSYGL